MSKEDLMYDIKEINSEDEDTQKDKYLSFRIANEDYAIGIKYISEIFGIQKVTQVPNIKEYIKGIINLRGMIVPVIDVRQRFGIELADYDDRTCIVVVTYENTPVGLIVDEVSEVLTIPESQVTIAPQTNKGTQSRFILGMGKVGSNIKILINIAKLLYDDDHVSQQEN